jgi:hypothetical protein
VSEIEVRQLELYEVRVRGWIITGHDPEELRFRAGEVDLFHRDRDAYWRGEPAFLCSPRPSDTEGSAG